MSFVRFRLGERAFALDVTSVREVARMVKIQPVIGLPPEVLGVIDVHGVTVPVLDLRCRLALPDKAETAEDALVIIRTRRQLMAAPVTEVEGILRDVSDPRPGAAWDCARGVIFVGETLITVLNADLLPTPALEPLLAAQQDVASGSFALRQSFTS